MKKVICAILAVFLCSFIFTACNNENLSTDYVSKNGRCIVSLPENYEINYLDNSEDNIYDEDLNKATTVNGASKKVGYAYYSVLINTPFRIFTPLDVILENNENYKTLVYWKLNNTLYKDSHTSYSENTFTCSQDTEITPLYYEFRTVGLILLQADENGLPALSDSQIFDDNGNIKVQEGINYFYGTYDFEPQKEVWKTNLTLDEFNISYTNKPIAINYNKRIYTINIKIKKNTIFDNGNIIVDKLCKIDGHGYILTYGASNLLKGSDVINTTYTSPVGEHQIKYTFID